MHTFWFQPPCFLTFSQIQPKMFLKNKPIMKGDSNVMIFVCFVVIERFHLIFVSRKLIMIPFVSKKPMLLIKKKLI